VPDLKADLDRQLGKEREGGKALGAVARALNIGLRVVGWGGGCHR
jgi:hypothetical protein